MSDTVSSPARAVVSDERDTMRRSRMEGLAAVVGMGFGGRIAVAGLG